MKEDEEVVVEKKPSGINRWIIYAAIVLVAFLLGFVPMWMKSRTIGQELATTQKQLRRVEVRNLLTTAIVEARGGEYEPARQATSEFFTNLNTEIERADEGILTADERQKIKPVFDNRDNIITMLAQRDTASVEQLNKIYVLYKEAIPGTAATK